MYANRARLNAEELMLRCIELEAAMESPLVDGHLKMAEGLTMYIARSAPNGRIANLAMHIMSDLVQLRTRPEPGERIRETLSQLRTALREAKALTATERLSPAPLPAGD